ncbi:hypothetical protein [Pseudoalteromonas rubra]|uniref:hypothetical protein n=1 Tax=Pseudoalteromonas rubra TaxID=43658 RepID=UPI00197F6838|nr:hypothetical protein [Pseudoalteromonas rubra]
MSEEKDYELESAEVTWRLYKTQAQMNFLLEMFGRDLAAEKGYTWLESEGIEAIRYYLMQKHNWLPSQVNSMSLEDLSFAVEQEKKPWTLKKKYRGLID